MATTRPRDRIIALVIAVAFFATAFATSFFVIWELYRDNKEAKTVNQTAQNNDTPQEGTLQGTKLAGFDPVAEVTELQIIDLEVGTGAEVKAGEIVTVDYTGALAADGTIFQSSLDMGQPVSFGLNEVIKGWTDGIPGMKVGGKRRLIIPADQAYGAQSRQGIPANSPLVFDVTLHAIGQ